MYGIMAFRYGVDRVISCGTVSCSSGGIGVLFVIMFCYRWIPYNFKLDVAKQMIGEQKNAPHTRIAPTQNQLAVSRGAAIPSSRFHGWRQSKLLFGGAQEI